MVSATSRGSAALHFSGWVFLGRVHGLGAEAVIGLSSYHPPCFSWSLCIGAPVKWAFRAFVGDRFPHAPHDSIRSVCRAVIGPMGKSYPQIPPKTQNIRANPHRAWATRSCVGRLHIHDKRKGRGLGPDSRDPRRDAQCTASSHCGRPGCNRRNCTPR